MLDHIVRTGTMSGAATALGVDQTTVSRRLAALERKIGSKLFYRVSGRLTPAPALAAVLDRLRVISEEAALSLAQLKRASAELRGSVRITSTSFILGRFLAPALASLNRDHPGVTLELLADDDALSFDRDETDIALRLGSNGDDSARIKKIGSIAFRLCRPRGQRSLVGVVRYGDELSHLPEMVALDRARPGAHVALKISSLDILAEAALALGAEVMLPEAVAARDARFDIVDEVDARADRPLYLLIHPERARVPSVVGIAAWIERRAREWR